MADTAKVSRVVDMDPIWNDSLRGKSDRETKSGLTTRGRRGTESRS
jgi:hypothetical protein